MLSKDQGQSRSDTQSSMHQLTLAAVESQNGGTTAALLARATSAERALQDTQYRQAILEARNDLNDAAYSRLEIGIGVLGIVMAVMLLFFAFRTEKVAKEAAREEVKNERDQIKAIADSAIAQHKIMFDDLVQKRSELQAEYDNISEVLKRIKRTDEEVHQGRNAFIEFLAETNALRSHLSNTDRQKLTDAEVSALSKDKADLQIVDYHALISRATSANNWWEVDKLAKELDFKFSDDIDAQSASLFYLAISLHFRKFEQDADDVYKRLINEFDKDMSPVVVRRVARARFNRARRMPSVEAQLAYRDIVGLYHETTDPELIALSGSSMLNRGVLMSRLDNFEDALRSYDELLELVGGLSGEPFRSLVRDALFNRACTHARMNDVDGSMRCLTEWAEEAGTFDHSAIVQDDAFDRIRHHEEFEAYLTAQ